MDVVAFDQCDRWCDVVEGLGGERKKALAEAERLSPTSHLHMSDLADSGVSTKTTVSASIMSAPSRFRQASPPVIP